VTTNPPAEQKRLVRTPRIERKPQMNKRVAHVASIAILAFALLLTPAALAAKGRGGGKPSGGSTSGSSIRLAPLVFDANGNGLPNHADVVTFNVSTTATFEPFVNVRCYQNGALVLNSWQGYFEGALNSSRDFTLGSGAWPSGAADCTASLDRYARNKWNVLATTSFHVAG
jgi:hypothetical protein